MEKIRTLLAELLLLIPVENSTSFEGVPVEFSLVSQAVSRILAGESDKLLEDSELTPSLAASASTVLSQFPARDLHSVLSEFVDVLGNHLNSSHPDLAPLLLQLVAVALLQLSIQANFTGPEPSVSSKSWFANESANAEAIKLLSIEGKSAYDLMSEPVFLVLALIIFERLMNIPTGYSLVNRNVDVSIEQITEESEKAFTLLDTANSPVNASLCWWRARALQVHLSVLSEPSDVLASVSSLLLQQLIVNGLVPAGECSIELQKHLQLIFLLEAARNGIHAQTEHLAEPFLKKANAVSQMQFVLSGARAKRTKFQSFHTASLILLAKSTASALYSSSENEAPEDFALDSDLLLERPIYESLDDLESEPDAKKIKLDDLSHLVGEEERLFPIAVKQEDIPAELRAVDPNNQPTLNDLDNVQLLLRLTTLRQTSPSGNALVEEELSAVVNRIVYSATKSINWAIFGRALWERSVLETNKSRTVERGILQMTSLVEEIGIKIKSRVLPQAQEEHTSSTSSRLRFIHQLPLMAQWTMDAKLAEKYMSLGVLKSAIEIYERLNMVVEAALCYAAVDNEQEAERMLVERLKTHPEDARAISILGDIKQDPAYWLKAWEVGRYAKAKASLSKYYYSPPPGSGLTRNLQLALENMQDCLTANPLSYENWFFYGCCGLEGQQYELASEAFTRCVSLDDTNSHAWSNLATALLKIDKPRQAFNALKQALQQGEGAKRSWRIFENYLIVAARLGEWNDVLHATRQLISIRGESGGEVSVDVPVLEKLAQILVEEPYPNQEEARLTHFQLSCIDLICNMVPSVITSSARCWRIVSRVELWRGRPWASLDCHEKAYRATSLRPDLDTSEQAWNDAVEATSDLVSAYESLGELPGKHGAGDAVCKDWKYKARTCVRSLSSKGKATWEDSDGWNTLQQLKEDIANA